MSNLGNILFVDNKRNHWETLVECFSAYGFELTVAHDAETALEKSELAPPDLILLDVMIPDIGGFETCRRLKENTKTKDIPVIFMKAHEDHVSAVKGFSVGAVDYVNKPIQVEETLATVTAHLKIRNLQKVLEETILTLQEEVDERKRAEETAHQAMLHAQQAQERMRRDLEAAARVQQALLPETTPTIPGLTFAWTYRPCAELGGDSLNLFSLSDYQIGMYVLDVTGHGVPASLLSVTLSRVLIPRSDPSCLLIRQDTINGQRTIASPAEVATRLNHMFPMNQGAHQYFTLLYGILDTQAKTFQYVCAGHPAPVVFIKDRQPIVCETLNLPIGLFENEQYENSTIELGTHSRIYLHSDGVLEAMNPHREIFGETRLRSIIESTQGVALQESVNTIASSASNWAHNGQVHDDLSILAMEFKPGLSNDADTE